MPVDSKLSNLCNIFFEIEQKFDLDKATINDIYFWKLIRVKLYYDLAQQLGIFDTPHPQYHGYNVFKLLYKSIIKFPWFMKKYKHIVFGHGRKVDGKDIYVQKYISNQNNDDFEIMQPVYSAGNYNDDSSLDLIKIIAYGFEKIRSLFPFKQQDDIQKIETYLENKLGTININLNKLVSRHLISFSIQSKLYKGFLKFKKVSSVSVVVGYGHNEILNAANLLGIDTADIQHATLSPYHLGYHYPDWEQVPYTANTFYTFGDFWKDAVNHPSNTNVQVMGAPSIISELCAKRETTKKDDVIAVMSQGIVGEKLFLFTLELAKILPQKWKIIFRLHPSEDMKLFEDLLETQASLTNLELSQVMPSTYDVMLNSKYVLGVASTTLYEGIVAGSQPIVVNLEGADYMAPMINQGIAPLVQNAEDCLKFIESYNEPELKDSEVFYKTK